MRVRHLSAAEARRVAVAASRIDRRPAPGPAPVESPPIGLPAAGLPAPGLADAGPAQIAAAVRRLGVLQIDSVNVFARAHYMPVFSRIGDYQPAHLDALGHKPRPRVFEYWGHEATFLPIEAWPLWQWRMRRHREQPSRWRSWAEENADFVSWLRDHISERGALCAREIEHERNRRTGTWWGWSDVKRGLEWLFLIGELTSSGRSGFERRYATPEQAVPAAVLAAPGVPEHEAKRLLVETAARNLGVFTLADAADYFRMRKPETAEAIAELSAAGRLVPVEVSGWRDRAWMDAARAVPRNVEAATLLSPFDPLVWFRPRAERLFDFHYRIEIYTPAAQRVFGYYSLPFLLDDRIVARVDLKADRKAGVLVVRSAWSEDALPPGSAAALCSELRRAARWQGLDGVTVEPAGNLAAALTAAIDR